MSGIPPDSYRTPSPRMYTSTPMYAGPSGEFPLRSEYDSYFQTPRNTQKQIPIDDTADISALWNSNLGVTIGTVVTQSLIAQPCIVLRRQCQVHRTAYRYHMWPWTLFPVIVRLERHQGPAVLWKGTTGQLIVRGMQSVIEALLAEATPFPKEVSSDSSIKQLIQHVVLKCVALALVTPFSCAALAESVQSDVASDKTGVLDFVREGALRLVTFTRVPGRMIPLWRLLVPSAALGGAHYVLASVTKTVTRWLMDMRWSQRRRRRREERIALTSGNAQLVNAPTVEDKMASSCFTELKAILFGQMIADVLCYPFETVVHRLYLQGTRTIIDNLDTGVSVIPVISAYEGPLHCWQTILKEEGAAGLYKGFGALVLQYMLHGAVLYAGSAIYRQYLEATLDSCALLPQGAPVSMQASTSKQL